MLTSPEIYALHPISHHNHTTLIAVTVVYQAQTIPKMTKTRDNLREGRSEKSTQQFPMHGGLEETWIMKSNVTVA